MSDNIAITDEPSLMRVLGRIESKIDTLVGSNKDHESRLKKLEANRNYERGIAAAIGAGASFLFTFFKGHG
jgi:hypothetical protein